MHKVCFLNIVLVLDVKKFPFQKFPFQNSDQSIHRRVLSFLKTLRLWFWHPRVS